MADLTTYLKAIANGETAELPEPTDRLGVYLKAIIDGNTDVPQPTDMLSAYLYEIAKNGLGGGGTGGDSQLDALINGSITEIKSNVTEIGQGAFFARKKMTIADFPKATMIRAQAFFQCSTLKALILRSEEVVTLENVSAFSSSAIHNNGSTVDGVSHKGYVYVPRSLLSDTDSTKDYRQATNWSSYERFRALEDFTVDGTITGALDESKI